MYTKEKHASCPRHPDMNQRNAFYCPVYIVITNLKQIQQESTQLSCLTHSSQQSAVVSFPSPPEAAWPWQPAPGAICPRPWHSPCPAGVTQKNMEKRTL